MRDLLSIIFRAFYRIEVRGLDNFAKAGPNAIIALNHVSFLDAALAMSLTDRPPVFAIDHTIAKRWWVKPFLRSRAPCRSIRRRPLATRTLINAVKAGEPLVIFPEGRLTVTGSLMKVYDGAGLIADKSDAMVVPVRIDGLEATPFTRLSRAQVRRRWFPKVTVTVLEPVKLAVPPALKGKARRPGGRRSALRDHVGSGVPYHLDRPHRDRGDHRGCQNSRPGTHRGGGSGHRRAHLQAPARRRRRARPQAHAARRGGQGASA